MGAGKEQGTNPKPYITIKQTRGGAGIDGGGSVRVPSALCGLVGLRPTVGRTSREHCPDNAFSIMAFGVLAASVSDALLVHSVISNAGAWHPSLFWAITLR